MILEHNLTQSERRAQRFEREFGMSFEAFAEQYRSGALGDDAQWFEWEFTLDAARETRRQVELLDNIAL